MRSLCPRASPSVASWLGRASLWAALLCAACAPDANAPVLDLPSRPADAPTGDQIVREIRSLDLDAREERIFAEVARGNVPPSLRRLKRVEMKSQVDGREHRIDFWVAPDYLAVGSDEDRFLVPLTSRTAQRIADLTGASLPTPRMVDAIWSAARVRLAPIRIGPEDSMRTVGYFQRHDRLIAAQRQVHAVPPGTFVAGEKVDIVLTPTLSEHPGRVAIYGWHGVDGLPIQPVFAAVDTPVVFRRGVRLVARDVLVDGAKRDLWDVLRDPELAPILSSGGVITEPRYPVAAGEQ